MTANYLSRPAIDMIAARELKKYKNGILINGEPCAVPIEDILELQYGLTVEYHHLRKNGRVLGQAVFENCYIPVYDMEKQQYTTIEVEENTLVIDCRLLEPRNKRRLRFTMFHEFSHWLLHKEMFSGASLSPAMVTGKTNDAVERQADMLCASLLMPKGQLKKAYYRLRNQANAIEQLADLFQVSKQAMRIRLEELHLQT